MHDRRFDALARALGAEKNRRQFLRGLLGLGGTALAGAALVRRDAGAARRGEPAAPTSGWPRTPTPTPSPPPPPAECGALLDVCYVRNEAIKSCVNPWSYYCCPGASSQLRLRFTPCPEA